MRKDTKSLRIFTGMWLSDSAMSALTLRTKKEDDCIWFAFYDVISLVKYVQSTGVGGISCK